MVLQVVDADDEEEEKYSQESHTVHQYGMDLGQS